MNSSNTPLAPAKAVARTLGWLTSVVTIVVLGFIANRWPERLSAVAAGMAGVAVALLNDSWQMIAMANRTMGFVALPPARAMLHDLVSMAISLGGLVLVIFTGTSSTSNDPDYNLQYNLDYSPYGKPYTLRSMMATAQWFLIGVVLWRISFAAWGCYDCMNRNMSAEQRRRHRQQMEEAQAFDA